MSPRGQVGAAAWDKWPLLLFVAGAVALRLLPERQAAFLPSCPIRDLTGFACPGCGGTRALLALLHGQFALAWHLNPLLVVLLPPLLVSSSRTVRGSLSPGVAKGSLAVMLFAAIVFAVIRNLSRG